MAFRLALVLLMVALAPACSSVRDAYGDQRDVPMTAPSFRDAYGAQTTRLTYAPRMVSSRKIAEQDCSKPIALDQGNLRCK